MLKAKNLHKAFSLPSKVEVLKGLCLEVNKGEAVAIMGRSGEGKSTLLQILGTLEKPCDGEIELQGKIISSDDFSRIRNAHIGFIFQSYNLLEDYTVLDNILMPARIARKPVYEGSVSYKRALWLLEELGIAERAKFPAKLLSGGEKQRAAIARALCNDPDLLLADEPSGNLDSANSLAIFKLLLSSVKKWGKTLIVVTHDKDLASLCDRTLLLKDGILSNP